MGLPRAAWLEARATIQKLLSDEVTTLKENPQLRTKAIVQQKDAVMHLPASIGESAKTAYRGWIGSKSRKDWSFLQNK